MSIDVEDNATLKLHEDARNTFCYKDVSKLTRKNITIRNGVTLRLGMMREFYGT